jgi:hypothetical protein
MDVYQILNELEQAIVNDMEPDRALELLNKLKQIILC